MHRTEALIILLICADDKAGVFIWAQGCEEADRAVDPLCFPLISVKILPPTADGGEQEGCSPLELWARFVFLASLLSTHWSFATVLVEAAGSGERSSYE